VPEPAQTTRRVFFAIWPDVAALDALELSMSRGVERCGGRRMRRDSLHVTLEFIGAVSSVQLARLHDAAATVRASPFEMVLDRLGWWPHNGIFWAGCKEVPSRQRRLLAALSQALLAAGFQPDSRQHVPHMTLLRQARCMELPPLEAPIRWQVDGFTLVESFLQPSGSRYRVLARWPLQECA
jgi:RNA 2',3'-cyclic 3'-phosphodiesterase